jgi:uncharacterized heparinase superfamily protein
MQRLKSIKIYFFSIIKILIFSFKNFYFKSSFYNKKLITFVPNKFLYNPSYHLSASLVSVSTDFYKITNIAPELLWKTNSEDKFTFENLHNFLWLTKLDRKNSKLITQNIIKSWINNFFDYDPHTWKLDIAAKRIIAWSSNTDITLEDSDGVYKENFFLSLIKQSNFIFKNIKILPYGSKRLICCASIILSGLIFKENNLSYKVGIKELEKIVKNYFDESGFPKSRNTEDVFICIKYLILIREWLKESQKLIPDFLNEIIIKCGNSYAGICNTNKQLPLFNGATEVNHKDYDIFLKNLKYKFINTKYEIGDLVKIKKKKFEFIIDCGNPPPKIYSKHYQSGCLSFELNSNKQKIICNSGYGKYLSSKLSSISKSTAAQSTLYLNNTSIEKHKIIKKIYTEDKDMYSVLASHNGYEKKFGCIHTRSIKILKKKDIIFGRDEIKKIKKNFNVHVYFIRFHIYPDTKIVKTKAGNSILISLSNGEGWVLQNKISEFKIEKNIFFGNKNKIINNESVYISGNTENELTSIDWSIERIS